MADQSKLFNTSLLPGVAGSVTSGIAANPLTDPAQFFASSPKIMSGVEVAQQFADGTLTAEGALDAAKRSILADDPSAIPTTVTGLKSEIQSWLKGKNIDLNPIPNSLDEYANYTYHIRFSFTGDEYAYNLKSSKDYQSMPKEVIAESGTTTGFNIKDFEMKNLCSPQDRVGIMLHTTWKMTIAEPYGFSFVDRLYTLATTIGIADHLMCPYFIEVWFNGYDEEGHVLNMQNKYYKVFRCFITELEADATDGGTIYKLSGVVDGTLGTSNEYASPVNNVVINNVGTLGEFFDRLETEMNNQMKNLQYDNNNKRAIYKFNVKKEWRAWKLTRKLSDPARTSGFEESGDPTKPSITVPRGKDISQILLTVMSMTEEGNLFTLGPSVSKGLPTATPSESQKKGQPQGQNSNNRSNTKSGTQGTSLIPVIHTEVKLVGFNYNIRDYVREITYHFLDYTTVRGLPDKDFINNAQLPEVQRARLNSFVSTGKLNKVYNFIFTGENVDVLKFDLKLENFWFAAQPAHEGENTISNFSLGPQVPGQSVSVDLNSQYQKAKSEAAAAVADLRNLESQKASIKTGNQSLEDQIKVAKQQVESTKKTLDDFIKKYTQEDFEIRFGEASAGEKSIAGIAIKNPDLLKDANILQDVARRAAYLDTNKRNRKDRYLEDVKPKPPAKNPLPITSYTTNVPLTQNNSAGGEGKIDPSSTQGSSTPPRSRGLLASVIHNVTGGPFFATIDLEIRGDPYWIGIDNIDNNKYISSAVLGNPPTVNIQQRDAFFGNGETAFLLFFRTGEQPNENTGLVEFNKTSWAFNGMYVVIEVTSLFKDGKFTQILHANKDVAMYSVFTEAPASPSAVASATSAAAGAAAEVAGAAATTAVTTATQATQGLQDMITRGLQSGIGA